MSRRKQRREQKEKQQPIKAAHTTGGYVYTPSQQQTLFQLPLIESCPIVKNSHGVVYIDPDIIEMIAAATLAEKIEWAVILEGTRSADGLSIYVTDVSVPDDQYRTAGNVELEKVELSDEVVGVLHSHHSMGAFFSATDKEELNPRFPLSIVVAQVRAASKEENILLGFDYQAVGKVKLPCGSLGNVEFKIMPTGVEDWPLLHTPMLAVPDLALVQSDVAKGMGDCKSVVYQQTEENRYKSAPHGACGLVGPTKTTFAAFGVRNSSIVELLPPGGGVQSTVVVSSSAPYKVVDKRSTTQEELPDWRKIWADGPETEVNDAAIGASIALREKFVDFYLFERLDEGETIPEFRERKQLLYRWAVSESSDGLTKAKLNEVANFVYLEEARKNRDITEPWADFWARFDLTEYKERMIAEAIENAELVFTDIEIGRVLNAKR